MTETRRSGNVQSAPERDTVVIEAAGLTKTFKIAGGEIRALTGVDLTVTRSQMLVLLGPSGCGKTTLLRCIGGLENPDRGQIRLGARAVTSVEDGVNLPPEHRNLGMMFQSYGLWPHMTALQNVAYPLTNKRGLSASEIAKRATAMLETMGISALASRHPGQLSGGQQQRIALARALVGSPTALLFDEPLSNVDAQVRKRLRKEIRQMKEERGFAGIYVTHDQEEAMTLADVLAVMKDGRIIQIGTPWDIYHRPRTLYVARFIGEINDYAASVSWTEGARLTAETALGPLVIEHAAPMPGVGEGGYVAVRPEDVMVLRPGSAAGGVNLFEATVTHSTLLGPRTELQVAIGGIALRVWISSTKPDEHPPGSSLTVHVPPGSAKWIKD